MTPPTQEPTDDPKRLSPRDRYMRDPVFHALVVQMYQALDRCDYTASELREAVMLAAQLHENRKP